MLEILRYEISVKSKMGMSTGLRARIYSVQSYRLTSGDDP